jgi:hypothetical protein
LPVANVVLDGHLVSASRPAIVRSGTVLVPIDPFVLRFATSVTPEHNGTAVTITRGERSIRIVMGSTLALAGGAPATLPCAPYVRDGRVIVPLAAIARSLGLDVRYDRASRSAYLASFPQPLTTMTPFVTPPVLTLPRPTFTAEPVTTPRPVFTGIPRARRTPIESGLPPL